MKNQLHSSLPRIPFTHEAFEKMQKEVRRLNLAREETLERLKAAREQGDLSENGAYRYAKVELGDIGRRLRELNYLLRFGVVETRQDLGVAGFGSTIMLSSPDKNLTFLIVSEHEANPSNGKLSMQSPLGQALLGKKLGDEITVSAPAGIHKYKITKIT